MEATRARSYTATSARHPPQPVRRVVAARCLRGVITRLSDNIEDPVLRTAVKEPLAFWGGMFAGALRLNLNDDPLRSWIERTSSSSTSSSSPTSTTSPSQNSQMQ
ncbi:hypothetical protein V8C86DRAFT_2460789, partial [Haematococcus lacustris]